MTKNITRDHIADYIYDEFGLTKKDCNDLDNEIIDSDNQVEEEIEVWKDLGKLEQQALKFKPKLDKMQVNIYF